MSAATLRAQQEQIWLGQDFSSRADYRPLPQCDGLSGQLPAPWRDESAWCASTVRYEFCEGDGAGFLRASADGSGKLQFMCPLSRKLVATTAWRITLRARSSSGVGLLLGVRQQDRPEESDRFMATALFNPTDQWKDYSFTMRAGADPRPVALYLNFGVHDKPVHLDLATIRLEQMAADTYTPPTTVPLIREEGAVQHHKARTTIAMQTQPHVIFLGDSITDGFDDGEGKDVWNQQIAPLNAVNFGIGANTIQHVLWQVQNMELGLAYTPKVIILMIGINNYFHVDSDLDIEDGIDNLVMEIRTRSPRSKLLILGILPQGREPGTLRREEIRSLNRHYAKLADGKQILFLDMGEEFLAAGRLGEDVSPDATHLTARGYSIWSREMLPILTPLLRY